jgi:hypothetical protein
MLLYKKLLLMTFSTTLVYPPQTGWPNYTPRHWVPFSSPPNTSRVTVEVFEPASTRDINPVKTFQPYLRSVLMLSSDPCLCIPSDLFPSGSLTKIIYLVGVPHAPIF